MFSRATFLTTLALMVTVNLPALAETCIPLSLVGGEGSKVTKTVSQPTIPGPFGITITRNNWNTDWAIPGGINFNRFVTTITAPNGGSFNLSLFLKYSDQTSEEVFNKQNVTIDPEKPLIIEKKSAPNDFPFQVNLLLGGIEQIGRTYTASVVGCYK
ncbi:hypothetical protein [Geminocystis sp.]|uniref:hypothetical protein n=1 Tax=Geminocystis sp. TaxID=2664100 RepID=UPI0035947414